MERKPNLSVTFDKLSIDKSIDNMNSDNLKCGFWRGSISMELNSYEFVEFDLEPAEILDYLYLGSEEHSANEKVLTDNGITLILNVANGCKNHFENKFVYKNLAILDNCQTDISEIFDEAIAFIEAAHLNQEKVLVHCQAGISRSATICVAYLMKTQSLTVSQAIEKVRQKRKVIAPNFSFMVQLERFYDELQVKTPIHTSPLN